jgi:hypothetical protein
VNYWVEWCEVPVCQCSSILRPLPQIMAIMFGRGRGYKEGRGQGHNENKGREAGGTYMKYNSR